MAVQTGVTADYIAIREAALETAHVLRVVFDNGAETRFAIASLPFATGPAAEEVHVLADGDLVELISTTGDFEVTGDELWAITTGSLPNEQLLARVGTNLRARRQEL